MKKVHSISMFLPSLYGGGAERVVVSLANRLAEHGHEVTLLVARLDGRYGQYVDLVSSNVHLVTLGSSRLAFALGPLVSHLRREKPQHLFSAITEANLLAIAAHRLSQSRCRLVISERSTLLNSTRQAGMRHRLLPVAMRLFYPRADNIIAISDGVASDIREMLGAKVPPMAVIPNPLTLDLPSLPDLPSPLLPTYKLVVLGAGRMEPQKDFPTLIRAFAIVRQSRPATLVILGDGYLRAQLQTLASDLGVLEDVIMPGFVQDPWSWMQAAEVFVLSSQWEGFGNVLLEAMACGTKVVSTDCHSGPREILQNGKWGRLVPVGEPGALAHAIVAAIEDTNPPDVKLRVSDFNIDAVAARYLDEIIGTGGASTPPVAD